MKKLTLLSAAACFAAEMLMLSTSTAAWAAELAIASGKQHSNRIVVALDGTWQIAEGKMDQAPGELRPHRAGAGPGVAGHAAF